MNGDLLFADPVGRFVRRAKIVKTEGLTQLRNAYPGSEFIIEHRPAVPPGQHQAGPGRRDLHPRHVPRHHPGSELDRPAASYLRYKIEQYGLDKVIDHGRIWRLRFDGVPGTASADGGGGPAGGPGVELDRTWPRMNDETPAQLVAHSRIRTAGGATRRSGCSC